MVSSGAQLCYHWGEEDLVEAVISDKVVVARLLANVYHWQVDSVCSKFLIYARRSFVGL